MTRVHWIGWCLVAILIITQTAAATVFINEVFINPPSGADDTREFIELLGTPGMKLDGYAVVLISGGQRKIHPDSPIPPDCTDQPSIAVCTPEIDEFFSLDGLSLGRNGILVIGIQAASWYPTLLTDSNFQRWNTLWNGGLDTPGKLQNDGSNTILLIRRRPGATQADPVNPTDLVWGKDIDPDAEALYPDPPNPGCIQYGDGNLDKGLTDDFGRPTLDLKGAGTPLDISDDLEVVDEVSYEQDQGWEHDLDGRHVDLAGVVPGLPQRHVHALDDPQGFNPDCLTRVDYRTKGPGWLPAGGAVGEMANGNNWPDTATEQWIRGESVPNSGTMSPPFFYSNSPNTNPDAIQPYRTNVPLWLYDPTPPADPGHFDFYTAKSYEIMAGRVNPLAVPFIPGDADRDGNCDAEDIAKIAAVFGDDDWIFSNSFAESPETDEGDPSLQTRPWDVDATGEHGIEPSDLQWTLNFQGNTNGRIVGMQYDSPTPASTGVKLNTNTDTACTVYASAVNLCGGELTTVAIGDLIRVTVSARVTAGAIYTEGEQNGVMQFVNDVALDNSGVLRIVEVSPTTPYVTTRADLLDPQGASGDLGVNRINSYTTDFSRGLNSTDDLYVVTLEASGLGSTTISVRAAFEPKFAASTPGGLKLGHTLANGNPAVVAYPEAIAVSVTGTGGVKGDLDGDTLVTMADVPLFVDVLLGNDPDPDHLSRADINCDGAANGADVQAFVERLLP